MKKTATILLWISLVLEVVYLVLTIAIAIGTGMLQNIGGATEGTTYVAAVLYLLITIGLPLLVQLVCSLVVIFGMKDYSEKIIMEIIAIILFSGILGIVGILANQVVYSIMADIGGSYGLAHYATMLSNAGIISFISSVSRALFLIANAFAIAYKKVEMVDIRRIREEEDV